MNTNLLLLRFELVQLKVNLQLTERIITLRVNQATWLAKSENLGFDVGALLIQINLRGVCLNLGQSLLQGIEIATDLFVWMGLFSILLLNFYNAL